MLNICKKAEKEAVFITLEGRLDTTTAPDLEKELKSSLEESLPSGNSRRPMPDTSTLCFKKSPAVPLRF